jgi:RND family efflux transporter MFP subunit
MQPLVPLLLVALLLAACERLEPPPAPPPPEVTVANPLRQEIVDWDEFTGRIVATAEVEIRARVSGYLQSVEFTDGSLVTKGQPLYVIDPRPFRASLAQAQAEQRAAEARLKLAENDEARAERLFKTRNIPEEELDNRRQRRLQAAAELEAARAAVTSARLDLDFAQVRAPISGRISRTLVTPGNLVKGNDQESTLLTTIVALDPIHVYLTAGENTFLRYLRLTEAGKRVSSREERTPVRMRLADEESWTHAGYLDFVDNQLDRGTGTIQARAIFPNSGGALTPGLFAKVQIRGEGPYPALLVPEVAVGTDQGQRVVYVLEEGDMPRARPVGLGPTIGPLRVIRKGLTAEDQILINGVARIRPGMPVAPVEGSIEAPPELALAGGD